MTWVKLVIDIQFSMVAFKIFPKRPFKEEELIPLFPALMAEEGRVQLIFLEIPHYRVIFQNKMKMKSCVYSIALFIQLPLNKSLNGAVNQRESPGIWKVV